VFAPDPTGGAYSAPTDTKLYLGGPSSKGRRQEGRGEEGKRRGDEDRREGGVCP